MLLLRAAAPRGGGGEESRPLLSRAAAHGRECVAHGRAAGRRPGGEEVGVGG